MRSAAIETKETFTFEAKASVGHNGLRSFAALMRWNLRACWRWWHPVAILVVFLFYGVTQGQIFRYFDIPANVWTVVFWLFDGPSIWDDYLSNALDWAVIHYLFLYITGDVVFGELSRLGWGVLPRVGSRRVWWLGKILTLLIYAGLYVLLGIVGTAAGAAIYVPWSWQNTLILSDMLLQFPLPEGLTVGMLIMWLFVLYGGTLFAFSVWQAVLSLRIRDSAISLGASLGVLLASFLLGNGHWNLIRWLPGSQSLLLRHTFLHSLVPGFTLEWSLVYNTVLVVIAVVVGAWYLRRMDIFGHDED